MYSFTFNSIDFKNGIPAGVEVILQQIRRPLINPRVRRKVEIPGRKGSWDFGSAPEKDFQVEVDIRILSDTYENVMITVRKIAENLDGKYTLVFGDELTKGYAAEIYDIIMARPQNIGNVVEATIVFECDADIITI